MDTLEQTAKRIVSAHAATLSDDEKAALVAAIVSAIQEHVDEERFDNMLEARNWI